MTRYQKNFFRALNYTKNAAFFLRNEIEGTESFCNPRKHKLNSKFVL